MLEIYNSQLGKRVPFHKKPGEKVGMYVCGPTVYDLGHLGHGMSAVVFDMVRRYLEWSGYDVTFVFNITDIEDKMITRAEEEGITVPQLADRILPLYMEDYSALGVKVPSHLPKATEHIKDMIQIIQKLEEKGCTYTLEDGVYFDIKSFPEYGKLSHQKLDELEAGARVQERKDKRNHQDFVLWKFKKEGEPSWPSPWGEGRPGWHIECSAMSSHFLGETFDIHGGGIDLKFPHHECEVAQSEAAHQKTFARLWMHNGHITVNQTKMSKSLGNFFVLREAFKVVNPRVLRFFFLSRHYRSPNEYSPETLEQARQTLKRLDEFYLKGEDQGPVDLEFIDRFKSHMNRDFDSPGALAALFEWMNSSPPGVRATLDSINEVLQIFPVDFKLTEDQKTLIHERETARQNKDWAKSDELRDQLAQMKIEVEDGPEGSFAKPKL